MRQLQQLPKPGVLEGVVFMTLNIVLVEPQIPQNTGNVARTCAATGVRLHLVGPMAFKIDDAKLKRAGLDYWHLLDITYYETITDFFEKNPNGSYYYFTTKAPRVYTEQNYPDSAYLLFGSETKGLDEELLYRNPERCVRLPMLTDARSMNLSSTVAVGVFEVLRQWGFPELQNHGKMTEITGGKQVELKPVI